MILYGKGKDSLPGKAGDCQCVTMGKKMGSPFELDGRLPLRTAIPFGLQHVLAMFIGNLTAPIIILGVMGVASGSGMNVTILTNAMFMAGIVTIFQLYPIWKIGAKLPIVMGTDAAALGVYISVVFALGGDLNAYGALLGACILGGLMEVLIGFGYKYVEKFFPPVVVGVVLTATGISLIPIGVNTFCGGDGAADFGSAENLFLAFFVLIAVLVIQYACKGFVSNISLLLGFILGYIAAVVMNLVLPHTFMYTDAAGAVTEVTKSWVLDWEAVRNAAWFAVPKFMPVRISFDLRAIIPVCIIFIALTMNTLAIASSLTLVGMGRHITKKEATGALTCDGLGSSVAALFGVLPNTTFSQNVGLINMTHVINRFSVFTGAVFLILCGFCPKLMAIISIMPSSVLGGAVCYMFGSILVGGISLLSDDGFGPRNTTIIAVSFGVAYALGDTSGALAGLPAWVSSYIATSGVATAAFMALILNIILPGRKKTEEEPAPEAEAADA